VTVANAGGVQASLRIDPSGNVSLSHAGDLTVATTGAATLSAATLTINAPTTLNGTLAVVGDSLTHNDVNVGDTHTHGGVKAGPDSTGAPA